jgi:hypothetical protein
MGDKKKFHTEDQHTVGAAAQNPVVRDLCAPRLMFNKRERVSHCDEFTVRLSSKHGKCQQITLQHVHEETRSIICSMQLFLNT